MCRLIYCVLFPLAFAIIAAWFIYLNLHEVATHLHLL